MKKEEFVDILNTFQNKIYNKSPEKSQYNLFNLASYYAIIGTIFQENSLIEQSTTLINSFDLYFKLSAYNKIGLFFVESKKYMN